MTEKYPLALSSSFLPSADESVLYECAKNNIKHLELSVGGACPGMDGVEIRNFWTKLICASKTVGIDISSAHLSFWETFDIASTDENARKKAVEAQVEMMRFVAGNTDVKKFVIHPSFEPIDEQKRFMHIQLAKQSLSCLADVADSLGAVIAVENLPRTCLGNSIAEMATIISCDRRLKVCFDTNHLTKDSNVDFIKALGDRIATVHISDYDRVDEKHFLPYEGVNNWKNIMTLLSRSGYSGPLVFEPSIKMGYGISGIATSYDRLVGEIQ